MAGITGALPFNPLFLSPAKTAPTSSLSLSSFESRLFGYHLRQNNVAPFALSSSLRSFTTRARYGGGSRFSGSGDSRRSRKSDSDDDQVLDVSTIRSDSVRLIDEKQNMVGIVSKSAAIQMAEDAELDLVILSPDADPPVVRIMNYSKYRYEQQKKKKEQQKKTSRVVLKELKMGYNIDEHDYSVRLKAARKFLKDGDKVKVIVNMKGRENEFRNIAIELIRRFQNDIGELATEESKNFRDRNLFIVLVPNKAVLQKPQEPPKKKNNAAINEVSAGV
ncbi:translation initiation factor IF3-2, chloroplastic [Carica papaya]|uniref:translation initiation factor IF3-2, chloroplastic n=1 Tax=Carica papaya TaxID=3649 RepID=UPI000B8CB2B3|nr:translation initiation factor IF3-2, chloroplastic [Carica papaya]XP_021899261.1 translation initiation factor IF3-2, chloroplastic [Carica papaya]XP_021899263.1 translation initiation factor IF3-2, chloroplastic [Carica papaya]XP_021899264.1 translation initiation factor IF3-2, chloroplastic [Carica papaya]